MKKISVPEELQAEVVAPEDTVEVIPEVAEYPVVDRFVELADQVRGFIALLPTGERAVSFALIQEMQELYEKK